MDTPALVKDVSIHVTFLLAVLIIGVNWRMYEEKKVELISADIQMAIDKDIDPIAVRCAYVSYSDSICLVYAAQNKHDAVKLIRTPQANSTNKK
jgi:hypothetical protein